MRGGSPRRPARKRGAATGADAGAAGGCGRALAYTIGKLSALTQVSADTLRYYEREKLLRPRAKSASGYRLYDDEALRRVRFIRHAQECGFTLAQIHGLLTLRGRDSACCNDVKRVAIERKLQLEARVRSMQAMSATLDRLIGACNGEELPIDACPILIGLEQVDVPT